MYRFMYMYTHIHYVHMQKCTHTYTHTHTSQVHLKLSNLSSWPPNSKGVVITCAHQHLRVRRVKGHCINDILVTLQGGQLDTIVSVPHMCPPVFCSTVYNLEEASLSVSKFSLHYLHKRSCLVMRLKQVIIHRKLPKMKDKILPTCLQGNYRDSLGEFSNTSYGIIGAERDKPIHQFTLILV